ncbi:MAG: hypothetical protein L0Y80_04795 [Ignavibacteriae bacterium]|nr:hypothetical protein [Ignavibacteriota bacterium]
MERTKLRLCRPDTIWWKNFLISKDEGEFRVTDEFGKSELYRCEFHRILTIRGDGVHKDGDIPSGHFLVEKISDTTVR